MQGEEGHWQAEERAWRISSPCALRDVRPLASRRSRHTLLLFRATHLWYFVRTLKLSFFFLITFCFPWSFFLSLLANSEPNNVSSYKLLRSLGSWETDRRWQGDKEEEMTLNFLSLIKSETLYKPLFLSKFVPQSIPVWYKLVTSTTFIP